MIGMPRVGFLGAGWIGRARLRAAAESGRVEVVAVADPDARALDACREIAPGAELVSTEEELLALPLDGVAIATPSGLHVEQCLRAFERGLSVFCQKPLGRTAHEVAVVTSAARRARRPLGVDLSYRDLAAFRALRGAVESGKLGDPYAVDVTFHNAFGPDPAWAGDADSAGGGALIDLGVHLLDAATWLLPESELSSWSSVLHAGGRALARPAREVEDHAVAQLVFENGSVVRLACSWRSSFGADARIRIACTGTGAAAAVENVEGSFYHFRCELYRGRERAELAGPPDAWGGRALLAWVDAVARGEGYRHDPRLLRVARYLDLLYGRGLVTPVEASPLPAPAASA